MIFLMSMSSYKLLKPYFDYYIISYIYIYICVCEETNICVCERDVFEITKGPFGLSLLLLKTENTVAK